MSATITSSAPGSLMISGEHAVLHGRHALVGAVDQRVRVTLTPRADDTIRIRSALGERRMQRTAIDASPPFTFIGAALAQHAAALPGGCDIVVEADFPHDIGLGSSAAVTVAMLAALQVWCRGGRPASDPLRQEALQVVRSVQGMGSGSDVAASVFGGVVLYRMQHGVLERFIALPEIALVYAGYKTPTPDVVRRVEAGRHADPAAFAALFERFDHATLAAASAWRTGDWSALAGALSEGQAVMVALGVCDEALAAIIAQMERAPGMHAAKISGSGLGDCVLGMGRLGPVDCTYRQIPVALSARGVMVGEDA
ncbi:MAG: GHMP kinase [Verrucomicrobia bacterium]|nr:GHMP kinase [Verrucomicrobiota bacterium]MBT7066591.1 GHMP kinase [Verrucomicrobiota bacterium]MBT7701521.1 GHMP kinase [Verrucomicrobiota bacterium]